MDAEDQQQLARALVFALEKHGGQKRKGSDIPYVSHLLQVCGMVLEHGGDVGQAVAALLHDTVEDCKGVTLDEIQDRFGASVADLVRDCTDTEPGEDPNGKRPPRVPVGA